MKRRFWEPGNEPNPNEFLKPGIIVNEEIT